ncbi:tetratricopeptide repeat protein [bacterium]|nr:tetratricopeptide repeat protein [bacterium]
MKRLIRNGLMLAALLLLTANSFTAVAQDNDGGEDTERLLRRNWSLFLEYFKTGDYKAAKRAGWKIIELDPSRFKTFHSKMIEMYDSLATNAEAPEMKTGYADTVLWLIDNAIEAFPDKKAEYSLVKGYQLERHFKDRGKEAIEAYETGINHDYTTADIYYLLRLAVLYSNDPAEKANAVKVLQAILLREPNNTTAQSLMKNLISDPEEYVGILRDAYYADSDNRQKLYELANGYYEMVQNYDSAAVYFGKLVKLDPSVKNYWERYAAALLYISDYSKASEAYKKVTELDPESKEAWLNYARSVLQGGNFSEARSAAEKAADLDPEWGAPHMVVANVYEAAVQRCVERNRGGWEHMKVIDKLVYLLARAEYSRAARDPQYEEQAKARSGALSTVVPTAEDLFVNKIPRGTPYMINKDCYTWIGRSVTP